MTTVPFFVAAFAIVLLGAGVIGVWAHFHSLGRNDMNVDEADLYRYALFSELTSEGVSRRVATLLGVALFPIDDEVEPSEGLAAELESRALAASEKVQHCSGEEFEKLAVDCVSSYATIAQEAGEIYYAARFAGALDDFNSTPAEGTGRFRDSSNTIYESGDVLAFDSADQPEA